MPSARVPRDTLLRAAAVALVTAGVTLAAACSDEDTVDTVPPPWPTRTTQPDGPPQQRSAPTTTTPAPTSTSTSTIAVPATT
jgi:hypothetical protein